MEIKNKADGNFNVKLAVYLNCTLYIVFITLVIGGIFQGWLSRAGNDGSPAMNRTYIIMTGVVVVITVLIMVGLMRFRSWGRVWAVVWNIVVALQLIGLKIISYFMLVGIKGSMLEGFQYFDADTILWFAIGFLLILLSFVLGSKSIKRQFT